MTGYWNKRQEDRYNWAQGAANATGDGAINGFAVTQGSTTAATSALTGGYTSTLLADAAVRRARRAGARFGEYRDPAQTFDPAHARLLADGACS